MDSVVTSDFMAADADTENDNTHAVDSSSETRSRVRSRIPEIPQNFLQLQLNQIILMLELIQKECTYHPSALNLNFKNLLYVTFY